MESPDQRLDMVLEFITLATDICTRYQRSATLCLFLTKNGPPFVVLHDDLCTSIEFHRELYEAADHCEVHRTASVFIKGAWEYVYQPLPTLAELLSDE